MRVFLGLGSNQGDRRAHLSGAIRSMRKWPKTKVLGVSGLYESAYVGPGRQAPYLNTCVVLDCELEASQLLSHAQELELAAGRKPSTHLRPRRLDIDILLYGGQELNSELLIVPHPRLAERRFVLEPLAELDADLVLPGLETTPVSLLQRSPARDQLVVRIADPRWCDEVAA